MTKLSRVLNIERGSHVSLFDVNLMNEAEQEVDVFLQQLTSNEVVFYLSLRSSYLFCYSQRLLDRLLMGINQLQTLSILDLSENLEEQSENVDNFECIAATLKLSCLENLNLSFNHLFRHGSKVVDFFGRIFLQHSGLKEIDLKNNKIGDLCESDFYRLCDILRNTCLEKINLGGNGLDKLSENSFMYLFNSLASISSLKKLDISDNNLTSKSLAVVTTFLEHSRIEEFSLNNCSIGLMRAMQEEWKAVFRVLYSRNQISLLELGSNKLEIVSSHVQGVTKISLISRFSRHLDRWTKLCCINISYNYLEEHQDILIFLARTMLYRNPQIGCHGQFAQSKIDRDFMNVGCAINMEQLIQDNKCLRQDAQRIEETARAITFLQSIRAKEKEGVLPHLPLEVRKKIISHLKKTV